MRTFLPKSMKSLDDAGLKSLKWEQSGKLASRLVAEGQTVATLTWAKSWGSLATGESADGECAEAAASRVRTVPGAVIKALRSGEAAPFIGAPDNDRSFRLEVDITSSSINGTYVFICKPKPGREPDLELIGID